MFYSIQRLVDDVIWKYVLEINSVIDTYYTFSLTIFMDEFYARVICRYFQIRLY